jgi:hypothetical protein
MFTHFRFFKACIVFFAASLLLFFGRCKSPFSGVSSNAFYYWETNFKLDTTDVEYLKSLEVNKLYLRFFDVDFESQAVPVGPVRFDTKIPASLEIIPVVFITKNTISKLDTAGIRDLSNKISTRIKKEIKRTQIGNQVHEIQMDCDWTNSTRDKYFYLLNQLQKDLDYEISATIRLHQYKYHVNNVPPVKKGMLMCYNINNPVKFDVNNSLFNKEEVMSYVKDVKYPLPLDIAMPTFSWGVVFDNNKQFIGLSNGMRLAEVKSDTNFLETVYDHTYLVKHDTYNYDRYLSEGSLVRIEECNIQEVQEVTSYLKDQLKHDKLTVSIYHYNSLQKNDENKEQILLLFNAAR